MADLYGRRGSSGGYRIDLTNRQLHALHRVPFFMRPILQVSGDSAESAVKFFEKFHNKSSLRGYILLKELYEEENQISSTRPVYEFIFI